MNKHARESLDAYFAEADSWAHDRQDALRSSRRIAWIVAIAAATLALVEGLALLLLVPLKTVVPYTLLVDRQTGHVQALKPLQQELVAADAALTQSFLVQYVIAREGFDTDALQDDYWKVALWSSGAARSGYLSTMQVSSPESPLVRYPRSTVVDVSVKSVTSLERDTAMVRFETRRVDAGGRTYPGQHWMAVVRYAYSGEPASIADRYINPLGFKVLRYRRSAETVSAAQPGEDLVGSLSFPSGSPLAPKPHVRDAQVVP